jgi:hypothetical protein
MKLAFALVVCCVALTARAQNGRATVSRSGQFIVYGVDADARRIFTPDFSVSNAFVRLDANLLAVSCERIKSALLNTLKTTDQWRGKIFIALHPIQSADEQIVVTSEHFSDGWRYRIELADTVNPERLVRALTQVLLFEMANRNARAQAAVLPGWLAEGLPQRMLAESDIALVLQSAASGGSPTRTDESTSRHPDMLGRAREMLRNHQPLTLAQLGQTPPSLTDDAGEAFQASAFLLVHELLELPNGGACLAASLPELPWDYDWRVAILKGFHAHFRRAVDLDKWWALQTAFVLAHTPERNWSRAETLKKLDEVLRCSLEVSVRTNEPPLRTDVSLPTLIKGWDFPRQKILFRDKVKLLAAVKMRSARELAGLVEEYRRTLETYLQRMSGGETDTAHGQFATGRHPALQPRTLSGVPLEKNAAVKDVLAQLDVLDQRREIWRALPPP